MGVITNILDGKQNSLLVEPMKIPFAPASDADCFKKNIKYRISQFLDVFFISDTNKIYPPCEHPNSIRFSDIFEANDEYTIDIKVVGLDVMNGVIRLKFKWTGDWEKASVETMKSTHRKLLRCIK
jgi:hypothetical protein